MKKFLKKIVLYGMAVLLVLNAIAILCLYLLHESSFYKPSYIASRYAVKNLDYIVIGSSIGLTSLQTQRIDSLTGLSGVNLSIDDTSLSSNYLMLRHFYELGKHANNCILVINYWDAANAQPVLETNDYRFLPFIYRDYVSEYYNALEPGYFKPLSLSRYLPAIGVAYYNTELIVPSLLTAIYPERRNRFDAHGDYYYPDKILKKTISPKIVNFKWDNPYIKRISELCAKHKTRLIIYQAPIYNTTVQMSHSSYRLVNHSQYCKDKRYFYDDIHLNLTGRQAATDSVAQLIRNGLFTN